MGYSGWEEWMGRSRTSNSSSNITTPIRAILTLCTAWQVILLQAIGEVVGDTLEPSPSHIGGIVLQNLFSTFLKSLWTVPALTSSQNIYITINRTMHTSNCGANSEMVPSLVFASLPSTFHSIPKRLLSQKS